MATAHKAYVSLLTKEDYLPGLFVLHHSLKFVGSQYPLVVMVTPTLSPEARSVITAAGIPMIEVDPLLPKGHKTNEHDVRFRDAWTKLRGFSLYNYQRIVLLDADMLIRRNMDELFDIELPPKGIAAAHVCACNPMKLKHYPEDWIPANCAHTAVRHPMADPPVQTTSSPRPYGLLNSGTVVLEPSKELVDEIDEFLSHPGQYEHFAFPDQDLLAAVFAERWRPLNWYYNALKTLRFCHEPEWSDSQVRCLHYILASKPWHSRKCEDKFAVVHGWWWDCMDNILRDLRASNPTSHSFVTGILDRFARAEVKV